jgi:TolA-binding protein
MWNALLGVSEKAPFALTLDEQRALYALRLSSSQPAHLRDALAAAKRKANDQRTCSSIEQSERQAIEKWSLDHISRLASIDPIYPAAYARGIASLRGGSYAQATNAFREWLAEHPDGALALRARSYLRWASRASQVE